jgi:hypothetical protein
MNKQDVKEYLLSRDLRASAVVRGSSSLIGLNQASGWVRKLRKGEDLSNPVLVMLWKIALEKEVAYSSGFKVEEISVKEEMPKMEVIQPIEPLVAFKEKVKEVVIPKKEVFKSGSERYFNGIEVRLIKKDSERVSWWIGADSMLYKSNEGVFTLQEVENYKGIGLSVLFKKYFG